MKRSIHVILWMLILGYSQAPAAGKITGRLTEVISRGQIEGDAIRAVIVLEDRLDLVALDRRLHDSSASLEERAYTVITELQGHARRSQAPLLKDLQSRLRKDVLSYKNFWIANIITLEAQPEILLELGNRSDISYIELDIGPTMIVPVMKGPAPLTIPGNVEPGLRIINAHRMWLAGFAGEGAIVMNLDSGVDGTHPALGQRWRGNHVPPSEAWFDPDFGTTFPVDYGSHGTHTMGTIAGFDPAYDDTIGVAPGAEWIAAAFSGTDEGMISVYEWAMDPDGDPGTTDDMPVVINNSWHWDITPCETPYNEILYALEVAGIAVVFSAGNTGPLPVSVNTPAKLNTTEMTVVSVGAVDGHDPSLPIMDFSSRGPTDCTGSGGQFKPELSAPGDLIRSSVPNGLYQYYSGTSMAVPHAAGAIALLKQAYPEKTGTELLWMLYGAAKDLGEPGEDNDFGMGVIDVYAAYLYKVSPGDPRRPVSMTTYSDYTTPTSVDISWIDPTNLVDGDTLTNFRITVWRDGQHVAIVPPGTENYTDYGLTDGQIYEYELRAQDLSNDSLSMPSISSVYSGGSPYPAPPTDLICQYDGMNAVLDWIDPVAQSDSTPLDDLEKIYIYRDDILVDSVLAGFETFTDSTVAGGTVHYHLRAVDNEVPPNLSEPGERTSCFIGDTPDFLVWVGPGAYGRTIESADSLFESLVANGESVFLTNDLFEFGNDLGIYEGIFAVLGVWWENHVMRRTDPEPEALEVYLSNGGRLYLECGDCFNYDPVAEAGYNLRPWFSLAEGDRGYEDILGVTGSDYLSSFSFSYRGMNRYMDDLQPLNSTTIWRNDSNEDICGVWSAGFGSGLAIGVVPSFGGLVSNPVHSGRKRLPDWTAEIRESRSKAVTERPPRPGKRDPVDFVKKYGHRPDLKMKSQNMEDQSIFTGSKVELLARTKSELMGAYLALFRSNPPFARNSNVNAPYLVAGMDTLIVTCEIVNPDSHSISVQVMIESLDQSYLDSIPMYDDGNHYDGEANDGIYGNFWPLPAEERSYNARVQTRSLTIGTTHYLNEYFTSIGPVVLEDYTFVSQDTIPNPGDVFQARLILRNEGSKATAPDITTSLAPLDSCTAVLFEDDPYYGDIAAGDTSSMEGWYLIEIHESCPGNEEILFSLDIDSDNHTFWTDTLRIYLYPVGIGDGGEVSLPQTFSLNQNFPNPFNPQTSIQFAIPSRNSDPETVVLLVYNMRGQLISEVVHDELAPGSYTVQWNGRDERGKRVPSGVYFYKLTWGEQTVIRKMVILK
jgi:subtilisin family serine protease